MEEKIKEIQFNLKDDNVFDAAGYTNYIRNLSLQNLYEHDSSLSCAYCNCFLKLETKMNLFIDKYEDLAYLYCSQCNDYLIPIVFLGEELVGKKLKKWLNGEEITIEVGNESIQGKWCYKDKCIKYNNVSSESLHRLYKSLSTYAFSTVDTEGKVHVPIKVGDRLKLLSSPFYIRLQELGVLYLDKSVYILDKSSENNHNIRKCKPVFHI